MTPTPELLALLDTLRDSILHSSVTDHERGYMLEEVDALEAAITRAETVPQGVLESDALDAARYRWIEDNCSIDFTDAEENGWVCKPCHPTYISLSQRVDSSMKDAAMTPPPAELGKDHG